MSLAAFSPNDSLAITLPYLIPCTYLGMSTSYISSSDVNVRSRCLAKIHSCELHRENIFHIHPGHILLDVFVFISISAMKGATRSYLYKYNANLSSLNNWEWKNKWAFTPYHTAHREITTESLLWQSKYKDTHTLTHTHEKKPTTQPESGGITDIDSQS